MRVAEVPELACAVVLILVEPRRDERLGSHIDAVRSEVLRLLAHLKLRSEGIVARLLGLVDLVLCLVRWDESLVWSLNALVVPAISLC